MRHGAEHQRRDQNPERIAMSGAGEGVTAESADQQRNAGDGEGDDQGVDDRDPEFVLDPGPFITRQGERAAGLLGGAGAFDGEPPALAREKVGLDLEAAPDRPCKGEDGGEQPEHQKGGGQGFQAQRLADHLTPPSC